MEYRCYVLLFEAYMCKEGIRREAHRCAIPGNPN